MPTSDVVFFKKIHSDAKEPVRLTSDSVGYDIFSLENVTLTSGAVTKVRTGITFCICPVHFDYYPQIYDKSSVFSKGIVVLKGVVDPGYRGEIECLFMNFTNENQRFIQYQPIAQIIFVKMICPILKEINTDNLNTERGARGFGEVTRNYLEK